MADKKVVTFGEIMMRLSPPGFQRLTQARSFDVIYGGGEANVAASLANFGEAVDFISRIPNNPIGEACIQFLRQNGIGTAKILRGGERLRRLVTEVPIDCRLFDLGGGFRDALPPGDVRIEDVTCRPMRACGWHRRWTTNSPR